MTDPNEEVRATRVAICECIGEQLERGETCGTVKCPNHPAVKIVRSEGWGEEEMLGYAADGRWEAVAEIAEQHANVQAAAMNARAAETLREFAALARAEVS